MIRIVQLENYLPEYLKEYKELFKIMEVENPEFNLAIKQTEKILNNLFISTCDEDGISKFEKLMNIIPFKNDRLKGRISRVMSRWYEELPYSLKFLIRKLNNLCGVDNYELDINGYLLNITTHFEYPNQIEEITYLLENVLPANMKYTLTNKISTEITDNKVTPTIIIMSNEIIGLERIN